MQRFKEFLCEQAEPELDAALKKALASLKSVKEPELKKIRVKKENLREDSLDEVLLTAPFVISFILASPQLLKIFTKAFAGFGRIIKKIAKKESAGNGKIETALMQVANKWHKLYIKTVMLILDKAGIYKAAKITSNKDQIRAAEVVFFTILFGFAIFGGFTTAKEIITAIKDTPNLASATNISLEGLLTKIKASEVKEFITKLA